jgi:serine/threonine protein kinase
MSDELDNLDSALSVEAFERVHEVCLAFEQVWQCGLRPKIESFLEAAEGVQRCCLLSHLLQLDIDYRRQQGDEPLAAEYHERFPDSAELVEAVFRAMSAEHRGCDRTQPLPVTDDAAATVDEPPCEPRGELITCPHCGSDVQPDNAQQQQITCANCGSTFDLDPKATTAYRILPTKIGRFEIIERLGRGAFGVVYKARDPTFYLTVAIKLARPETLDTQQRMEQFLNDAQAARRLKHPHIAQVYDIGYDEQGLPYIVCEFIEGMTLEDRLTGDPFPPQESTRLVSQIADALQYAHDKGVVHRDIKPSNIMIDFSGMPFLIDFGLAHCDEGDIHETLRGQFFGTLAYMSPEQARMDHELGVGTDIYSLGVVLYELLTNELPFRGKRNMLLHQVKYDEPQPPRRLNDHIPRDAETICLKCLEKEPRNRYPSAEALREDLDRYLRNEPILARPVSQMTRGWRWCMRNRLISGLAGSVVLLLVLLVVVLALLLISTANEREYEANIQRKCFESLTAIEDLTDQLRGFAQQYEQIEGPFPGLDYLDKDLPDSLLFPDLAPLHKHIPALTEAIVFFSDRDPDLCLQAVRAVTRLKDAADIVIPLFQSMAEDGDSPYGQDADTALKIIETTFREAIPALQEAEKAKDSRVAEEAGDLRVGIELTLDVKLQEPTVEDDKE